MQLYPDLSGRQREALPKASEEEGCLCEDCEAIKE